MASGASGIRAGRAFVELGVNDASLQKGLLAAEKKLQAFGKGLATIGAGFLGGGALITAPLFAAAKAAATTGAALYDMSQRTGVSVEALSAFGYAAAQTGSDLDTVEKSVRQMQKSIAGVKDDAEGTTGSLEELGISLSDIKDLNPADQFRLIATRLRGIADPTKRAAAAMKVFGRSGTALLPMINELDDLTTEAEKLGLIRTTESAKQADALDDAFTRLQFTTSALSNAVGDSLNTTLQEYVGIAVGAISAATRWVREHKQIVVTAFKIAAVASLVGGALVGLGGAISVAGFALGGLAKSFSAFASVGLAPFKLLASSVGIIVGALSSLPGVVAVAGAALLGLGVYFFASGDAAGKAVKFIKDQFGSLLEFFGTVTGGIRDALVAGDILLAARILWLSLRVIWLKGIAVLQQPWQAFLTWMVKIAGGAFFGLQSAWAITAHAFESVWIDVVASLGDVWDGFVGTIYDGLKAVIDFLRDNGSLLGSAFANPAVQSALDAASERIDQSRAKQQQDALANKQRRDTQAATDHSKEDKDFEASLARIGAAYDALAKAAESNSTDAINKAQADLDAAMKELNKAKDQAHQESQDNPVFNPEGWMKDWQEKFASVSTGLSDRFTTRGTFAANAVQSLAGSTGYDKQTAKNTSIIAKYAPFLKDLKSVRSTFT